MLKNSNDRYGLISTYLHWLSALLIIGLFAVGYWMVDLNYYSEWYRTAPHYHKSFGLLLLFLTIGRVIWKFTNISPKAITNTKLETTAVKGAHSLLYIGLLTLLISGYLISTADGRGIDFFNVFTLPSLGELFANQEDVAGLIHEYVAYGLIGLALLHAIAALKHHFISKDDTLKRITQFN